MMDTRDDNAVPVDSITAAALAAHGPILLVGAADTGKSTLARHIVKTAQNEGHPVGLIDGDIGQSEIGPPGMMELAIPGETGGRDWQVRGQWFVGTTTPYSAPMSCVVGIRRLADRARELDLHPLIIDTTSFVNTVAGHALKTAKVDALCPGLVIAIQRKDEMERWLGGVGRPFVRAEPDPRAHIKPASLRALRRGSKLAAYFQNAAEHVAPLLEWSLRGTRLAFGQPLVPGEYAGAGRALNCRVVHAERAGGSVALWVLGAPSGDLNRVATDLRAERVVTINAGMWTGRSVGLIGADGFCLAQGVVERVNWTTVAAHIRAPLWSLAEVVSLRFGTLRHKMDGTGLPSVASFDE